MKHLIASKQRFFLSDCALLPWFLFKVTAASQAEFRILLIEFQMALKLIGFPEIVGIEKGQQIAIGRINPSIPCLSGTTIGLADQPNLAVV